MYIVMGSTGHVGSAVAEALLEEGHDVTVVTRDRARASALEDRGASVAPLDVRDSGRLREAFAETRRAFVLNPPADPSTDTDLEERRTVDSIVEALAGSGLERVVVASTYGARPGERCGDLTVLHELEQRVAETGIATVVNRGAYYFSNWDAALETATQDGTIVSMFPGDFVLPMVAPADLGSAAAARLTEPEAAVGVHHVEGPRRYSPNDVAASFARALGRHVDVAEVPQPEHRATFASLGFSDEAAESYARMTEATLQGVHLPEDPERGTTELDGYVTELVGISSTS